MRRYLLAAVAAAAIASPAMARDGSGYVGLDLGPMLIEDIDFDFGPSDDVLSNDALTVDHKTGYDIDLNGGYDFGMFRAEAEIGYKRAGIGDIFFNDTTIPPAVVNGDGHSSALSVMANGYVDFGDNRWTGYVGAGLGLAKVKASVDFVDEFDDVEGSFHDSDTGFAWQALAGVKYAVTDNIDVGVKYRFFNVKNVNFNDDLDGETLSGKWRSHSLMLTLAYNFYSPPAPVVAPPPPPPPPPATQTCPDGSVILATEACPAPPPPPPPPPPAPERG